jgi:hypothetical protein
MPTITTTSQFVGKYKTHVSEFTLQDLVLYIERMEYPILLELFGKELYDLWNGSILPEYTALTEPFAFQDNCGKVWQSKGIVDMLTGFIYFEYQRDMFTQQTINGAEKNVGENSGNASHIMSMLHGRYDEALLTYNSIQAFIKDNLATYPEFKGVVRYPIIPYF